jgi:hypothetical protein
MTSVVHYLINILQQKDHSRSFLALQVLQRVVPNAPALVDALTIQGNPEYLARSYKLLLISLTKHYTFERNKYNTLQEWWKSCSPCNLTLSGLYYSGASYQGFVRSFIEKEFKHHIVSDITHWATQVYSDTLLLEPLLILDTSQHSCVCQKIMTLRQLTVLSTPPNTAVIHQLAHLFLEILSSEQFVDCVTNFNWAVIKLFQTLPRLISFHNDPSCLQKLHQILEYNPQITGIVVNYVVDNFTFSKSLAFIEHVKNNPTKRCHLATTYSFLYTLLEKRNMEQSTTAPSTLINLVLIFAPPLSYQTVVSLMGKHIINSDEWITCIIRSTLSHASQISLISASIPFLDETRICKVVNVLEQTQTHKGSSIAETELLCSTWSPKFDLNTSDFYNTKMGQEVAASCGDWNILIQGITNTSMALRILTRLQQKHIVIPDEVIETLIQECLKRIRTTEPLLCSRLLHVVSKLNEYKPSVAADVIKSFAKMLMSLPKFVGTQLSYTRFIHFTRVWVPVVNTLPTYCHRQNLMLLAETLSTYKTISVKTRTPLLPDDVCKTMAHSLKWQDLKNLETLLYQITNHSKNKNVQVGVFFLNILFLSNLNRKRLVYILNHVKAKEFAIPVTHYKAIIAINCPLIMHQDTIYQDMSQSACPKTWSFFIEEASQDVVETFTWRLIKDSKKVGILNRHASILFQRCRPSVLSEMLHDLITYINNTSKTQSMSTQVMNMSCLGKLLDSIDESSIKSLPDLDISALNICVNHHITEYANVVSNMILLGTAIDQRNTMILHQRLPEEIVNHVSSFVTFEITKCSQNHENDQ